MNESYKQIYATEKYVDDAINLTSQADWEQNDSTASDYIKNKPCYSDSLKDDEQQRPIMLDPRPLDNGYHLIMDCTPAGTSWYYAWYKYNSVRVTGSAYRIVVGSANEGYEDNPLEALIDPASFECIDTENYKFYHNLISANIYVIVKTSLLSEANKNNFPSPGIYLELTENLRAKTALVYAFLTIEHQIKDRYIPSTIARTDYVDKKIAETIPAPATASIGQTIIVSAVDENSKPTAWEATEPGEVWELIADVTIEEEIQTVAQLWEPMKKVRIEVYTPATAADTNYMPVTIYTTDNNSPNFVTGRFYPTALPRKSEYRSEYRIAMEEYDDEIIMRFTESNNLVRDSNSIVGTGPLKEVTSDGNSVYTEKFDNAQTTGMQFHTYSIFPVGTTFRFWGVRA